MRVVRVDEPDSEKHWYWLAAGIAIGLAAGVAIGRRRGGRLSWRALVGRLRALAGKAGDLGPLLAAARDIKAAWDAAEDADEADVRRSSGRSATDDEEDAGLDGATDDGDDDGEEVDDEDAEAAETDGDDALDARVLEAFLNDPVLAERPVEIDEERPGSIVLHGEVRGAREIRHAVTIARGVPGVVRVRERLTVRKRSR